MPLPLDFTPLNKFFDHIYVLTLERELEKQERISDVLNGLEYELFMGVDKKNLTIDQLIATGVYDEARAIELHRYDKPMNTGQIGCCISHKMIYEDVISKGYEKVLILEDDIVPQKEGFAELAETLAELPDDWELVYFDYCNNIKRNFWTFFVVLYYHILKFFKKVKWSHTTIANFYTKHFSKHLQYAGYHNYASAYGITNAAAKKLIELQTPISFVADNLLSYACSNKIINGFITTPKPFEQSSKIEIPSPVMQQMKDL